MVGIKRREISSDKNHSSSFSSSSSASAFSTLTYCQQLQFDDENDVVLTSTTNSTSLSLEEFSPTKYVHFNESINQIIATPSRYDYFEAGIQLWWTNDEIKHFRRDYFLSLPTSEH